MKIKILSDSTCDLSQALIAENDITLVPLVVVKDDVPYRDGVTITPQAIFDHVAAGGSLCSTAALNIADYQAEFAKYAADYDGVLHISIGSGFSSCYQNACLAAGEFDNVAVVDSMNLSTGQGLVVLKACQLAKSGLNLSEIKARLEEYTPKVEASFLLDRLDYMVKGGRCSMVAALGANLLNLKPCIEVREGKMVVVKKYRGNYARSLATYVKDRLEGREDLDESTLFLTYTPVTDSCYTAVKEALGEHSHFAHVYETTAGCTISCHCGPGTLGILFARK